MESNIFKSYHFLQLSAFRRDKCTMVRLEKKLAAHRLLEYASAGMPGYT